MNNPLKSVSDDALCLPPEDRLRLVERLLASITPVTPAIDSAWSDEIAARVRAFDENPEEAIDADDVLAEARRALGS